MDRIFRTHANEGQTTREETCAHKCSRKKREHKKVHFAYVKSTETGDQTNKQIKRECVSLRFVVPEIATKTTKEAHHYLRDLLTTTTVFD